MNAVKQRINKYEESKKAELVVLGNSTKPYKDILKYLQSEISTSTKMTNIHYGILCWKNDGVYALNRAIEEIYGVSQAKGDDKPSGGVANIETVDVQLANGTRLKVPYGKIELPEMGKDAHIQIKYDHKTYQLMVTGTVEFRFASLIDDIIEYSKQLLNTSSIYKDQAIELDSNYQPSIMNLSNIDKEFMVLSDKAEYDLRSLYVRIKNPEKCRAQKVPLKTGILMEGPYGTGKTLAAFKIAKEAIKFGWSFIYLKDPTLLAQTLRLSKTLDNNGNGVIVFLEDIDQVTRGDRNASMQDILNTLDGGDTKQMNVIALFTTNHIELIDPTFLRGKRIGSIVSLGALDAKTTRKFLDHTFSEENSDYVLVDAVNEGDITLDQVCENIAAAGIVPAFMAEIVEQVKTGMIYEDNSTVEPRMLQYSLESYLRQVALAATKKEYATPADNLAKALQAVITSSPEEVSLREQVQEIHEASV